MSRSGPTFWNLATSLGRSLRLELAKALPKLVGVVGGFSGDCLRPRQRSSNLELLWQSNMGPRCGRVAKPFYSDVGAARKSLVCALKGHNKGFSSIHPRSGLQAWPGGPGLRVARCAIGRVLQDHNKVVSINQSYICVEGQSSPQKWHCGENCVRATR